MLRITQCFDMWKVSLHVVLARDKDHKKVFPEVPIIDFKNNKNLKSYLVRTALPGINDVGRCEPCSCKRPPCELGSSMKNTSTFKRKHSNEEKRHMSLLVLMNMVFALHIRQGGPFIAWI